MFVIIHILRLRCGQEDSWALQIGSGYVTGTCKLDDMSLSPALITVKMYINSSRQNNTFLKNYYLTLLAKYWGYWSPLNRTLCT